MARNYRYISADSHYESPPEQWTHRVAKKYRERAPRRIKLAKGQDALVMEGRPLIYGGTSLYGGRAPEVFDPTQLDYDHTPGCGPAEQRLREQDQDGVDAEVLFALDVRNSAIRDKAARIGVVQGFNDFFAEEYCAVDRDRLIGMAVLPNSGVAEDIAEMERCRRKGLKGAWLSTFPSGKGYPTDEDDRFWAAALDLQMPLVIHTSFPTKVGSRETPLLVSQRAGGRAPAPNGFCPTLRAPGATPFRLGGNQSIHRRRYIRRFPKLRIYWAENNVGWLPYFGEQIDHEYETNRFWAERQMGLPRLKRLPSEYLKENAYWGFLRRPHRHEAAPRDRRRPDHVVDRFSPCGHALAEFFESNGLADDRRAGGREAQNGRG